MTLENMEITENLLILEIFVYQMLFFRDAI